MAEGILLPGIADVCLPLVPVTGYTLVPAGVILGQLVRGDDFQACAVNEGTSIAADFVSIAAAAFGMSCKQFVAAYGHILAAVAETKPANAAVRVLHGYGFQSNQTPKSHVGQVSGAVRRTAAAFFDAAAQETFPNENHVSAAAAAAPGR